MNRNDPPAMAPLAAPPPKPRGALLFTLGALVGLAVGFGLGVLSVKKARDLFANMFEDEQRADDAHALAVDRPAFAFAYPGNWKIDTASADYDPDHHLSIDSPGQSFVMISIADGALEPKTATDAVAAAMTSKVMRDATRAPFTRWGAFDGEGARLAGKNLGLTPATVRIFSFAANGHTFTITESTFDEDRAMVAPGFALVESSFRTKAPR